MTRTELTDIFPLQSNCSYLGRDFRVSAGVNHRDGLCAAHQPVEGDIYRLSHSSERHILRGGVQFQMRLDLMTPAGEMLALASGQDPWGETVLLAENLIKAGMRYELIKIETAPAAVARFIREINHVAVQPETPLPAQHTNRQAVNI